MSETTVSKLPIETSKLITSTQIVTSVATTVKELFENALDAGAKTIQVRLENYGLDVIEVKDNGSGVSYDNVQRMFLPGYTSKLRGFKDLESLRSYGFRGEALAAICKIAKVTITTKTALDSLAMTYDIDSTGLPQSSKPSHLNNGTIITVTHLFSNFPVRRLYLNAKKKQADELKKTEQTVQSLSLIHPELNVSLIHNKCIVWKKNAVKCLKQSFMQVVTLKTVSKMDHINKLVNNICIDLIIPKKNLETVDEVFTNSVNGMHVYVNKRPIDCKTLSQPVQEHIFHHYKNQEVSFKYATILISVNLPPHYVDINLEPNKTKILLKNQLDIIKIIDDTLINYYNNVNFHCTSLKEMVVMSEECEDEIENTSTVIFEESEEEQELKRPRLEAGTKQQVKPAGRSIEKFVERNWQADNRVDTIVNEKNSSVNNGINIGKLSESPQGLCSQINKDNCTLTTTDEVNQLNSLLNEQNFQSVVSINSKNCTTRLVERNDLQSQPTQKKILPEWPVRESYDNQIDIPVFNKIDEVIPKTPDSQTLDNVRSKTIQEIAAEIENDVEKWSMDVTKAMTKTVTSTSNSILVHNSTDDQEDNNIANFDLSMESISSQMGKKEMKAFTKFARIMRPKILAEFPKLVFTQVSKLLAERWKALTPTEVKYYENMAEVVDLNRKIYREEKETMKQSENPRKSLDKNLKSVFEKMKRKNKLNRPPRKEITMPTSINQIRKSTTANPSQADSEPEESVHQVIGQLQPSRNWLYVRGREIGHIRHEGLREVIAYQKMLSGHGIQRKILDKPISVNKSNLGDHLWQILLSLSSDMCASSPTRFFFDSDLIVKNGFQIEFEKDGDVISCCYLTQVAAEIPQFGLEDLKDALTLYSKYGEAGGLVSWRPTSVSSYLMNEAVRLNQSINAEPDLHDLEEMLNTYHLCLRHLPPVCLHSREFFVPIHHIQ